MTRNLVVVFAVLAAVSGCGKGRQSEAAATAKVAPPVLLMSPEDLITLHQSDLAAGPIITGTIQPERRADLRAEVSAVVLQVMKDNGETVRQGDTLVRLDPTAIRDTLSAADATARAAAQALEQSGRQLERLQTLRQSGMTSTQALEDAETRRNNLQSDLSAARARAVLARQQLQRTDVRAPFSGVISERKASAGDTVQIGKELLKVVDPASMRFEGLVSADQISSVKLGQSVHFRVNGYEKQEFSGTVRRIAPSANVTTRQVEVLVGFADGDRPQVSGLYAEGQIAAASSRQLMLPEAALVRNGDSAFAWRIRGSLLQKVAISIGQRDPRHGDYPVASGLADGDRVVKNPLVSFKDGQAVELAAAPKVLSVVTEK